MTLEHTKQLYHIMSPLEGVDPQQLRKVAAELVGRGGEYTACGRCLERAVDLLHPDVPAVQKRQIGFEEGYGGMTLPMGGKR